MSDFENIRVQLRVLTPEQVIFDGPVDWAQVPLEDGLLGVWPDHAPLVAATGAGELAYHQEGETHRLAVGSGVLRIDQTHCVVLFGSTAPSDESSGNFDGLVLQTEEALHETFSEGEIEELQRP